MHTLILSDLSSNLRTIFLNLKSKVDGYINVAGPDFLGKLVAAVVIFFIGKWTARIVQTVLSQVLRRAKVDQTVSKFLCRIAYSLIICGTVLASLEKLGVNTNSMTAVLAAAGLAIGLSLQGSLSNFAAGVIIILFRPFKVGDLIQAAGTTGVVEEIHIFHTLLHTPDNLDIIVPNSEITAGNITNFSSKPERRIDLIVGCGYSDDLRAVKTFLHDIIRQDERVLENPQPVVAVHELGDNSVNFVVRPWVKNTDYWQVRWDLMEQIKLGFDEHGFSIPFPQRDVHVHSAAASAETPKPRLAADTMNSPPAEPEVEVEVEQTEALADDQNGLLRPRRVA